jgi:dihydrofolate reductase
MPKVILYIATSLDGKIARSDGSVDWLESLPNPNGLDYGYAEFLAGIGTTIMGRKTYEVVLGFGVDWPYVGLQSYVATSDQAYVTSTPDTFRVSYDLAAFVGQLKSTTEKDIWLIGGGELIRYFLEKDLLDEMILTIFPTILGEGIQLFPGHLKESNWQLMDIKSFETGIVNLTYQRLK